MRENISGLDIFKSHFLKLNSDVCDYRFKYLMKASSRFYEKSNRLKIRYLAHARTYLTSKKRNPEIENLTCDLHKRAFVFRLIKAKNSFKLPTEQMCYLRYCFIIANIANVWDSPPRDNFKTFSPWNHNEWLRVGNMTQHYWAYILF